MQIKLLNNATVTCEPTIYLPCLVGEAGPRDYLRT